ncbi:MAG: hypothetical protein AB2765_07875 [Candidatus Thiodiazotropha endolucinida]
MKNLWHLKAVLWILQSQLLWAGNIFSTSGGTPLYRQYGWIQVASAPRYGQTVFLENTAKLWGKSDIYANRCFL